MYQNNLGNSSKRNFDYSNVLYEFIKIFKLELLFFLAEKLLIMRDKKQK